jgi:hypothetical protein
MNYTPELHEVPPGNPPYFAKNFRRKFINFSKKFDGQKGERSSNFRESSPVVAIGKKLICIPFAKIPLFHLHLPNSCSLFKTKIVYFGLMNMRGADAIHESL